MSQQSHLGDFENGDTAVLKCLAYWLQDNEVNGERISDGKEPPIREIANHVPVDWTKEADRHYERLRNEGVLETTKCCRRTIKWTPTLEALVRIENDIGIHIFDINERPLQHIKGKLAAQRQAKRYPDFEKIISRPTFRGTEVMLDFAVKTQTGSDWFVEMVTEHDVEPGPLPPYVWPWQVIEEFQGKKIWIFENRWTMLKFFNNMHDADVSFRLAGGKFNFDEEGDYIDKNPNNWPAVEVTRRINKTATGQHLALTLTSLIENESLLNNVDSIEA